MIKLRRIFKNYPVSITLTAIFISIFILSAHIESEKAEAAVLKNTPRLQGQDYNEDYRITTICDTQTGNLIYKTTGASRLEPSIAVVPNGCNKNTK